MQTLCLEIDFTNPGFLKYHRWVNLEEDTSLGITEFKFLNGIGEEIEIN